MSDLQHSWLISLSASVALSAVSVPAQVIVDTVEERRAARLAFAAGFTRPAEICVQYGPTAWRAEYEKSFTGDRAEHFRLGSGFWASLHSNVELKLGGKAIPAAIWYLGLHRTKENQWHLTLLDSDKLHRTGLTSGATRDSRWDVLAPLEVRKLAKPADKLTIQLRGTGGRGKPVNARLILQWGPHEAELSFDPMIEVGRPQGEPAFAPFDPKRVVTTASGLRYQELRPGLGDSPKPTSKVRVNYVGWLTDGTRFDSTFMRKQSMVLPLNMVIKGWQEGILLMRPGAIFRFEIPSDLAYGAQGAGAIGPDATLVFWIELLGF